MSLVTATSLRTEVSKQLRSWIVSGRLAADSRIVEAQLTEELGVSRTPLREALLGLEKEGLVRSVTNKGFRVAPLDPQEVIDLYPILGSLEATAIRICGPQLRSVCNELRRINDEIRAGGSSDHLYRLDLRWHELLWRRCPNQRLVDLISSLKLRVRRFDGAYERGVADVPNSCDQHDHIIDAIERGDVETAAIYNEEHWRKGTKIVLDWIDKRQAEEVK